jgi:hypothetical protein
MSSSSSSSSSSSCDTNNDQHRFFVIRKSGNFWTVRRTQLIQKCSYFEALQDEEGDQIDVEIPAGDQAVTSLDLDIFFRRFIEQPGIRWVETLYMFEQIMRGCLYFGHKDVMDLLCVRSTKQTICPMRYFKTTDRVVNVLKFFWSYKDKCAFDAFVQELMKTVDLRQFILTKKEQDSPTGVIHTLLQSVPGMMERWLVNSTVVFDDMRVEHKKQVDRCELLMSRIKTMDVSTRESVQEAVFSTGRLVSDREKRMEEKEIIGRLQAEVTDLRQGGGGGGGGGEENERDAIAEEKAEGRTMQRATES